MIQPENGETPNEAIEDRNMSVLLREMDELRDDLAVTLEAYLDSPSEDIEAEIADKSIEMVNHFGDIVANIFEDPALNHQAKQTAIYTLQTAEELKRQNRIILILDKESPPPSDEVDIEVTLEENYEEPDESDIDYQSWGEEELAKFQRNIASDMTDYVGMVTTINAEAESSSLKRMALDKIIEVGTIAGGVALGVLVANKFKK